jgi:hypothetical protein
MPNNSAQFAPVRPFVYERRDEPLLSGAEFTVRWLVHFLVAIGFVVLSLAVGMLGFVYFENKHVNSFHDALLNAAMLLGGMGPIHTPETPDGKLFAALYALYAGLAFLGVMGLLFAPVLHRSLHHFHFRASSYTGRGTPVELKKDSAAQRAPNAPASRS